MPVYNGAKYLHEAIKSILDQSFMDFEFLIINDGSTDDSEKIILSFKDPRIVFIKNESNMGLINSLNKGLKIAKGNYIARMDADDVALPQRLELQVKEFESDPKAIAVGSDYFLLTEKRTSLKKNKNNSDYQKAVLFFSPCFCHPTVMMKNIFAEKNLLYKKDYVHAEDYKLWTDLAFFGEFRNVAVPLLKYRSHATQISNQNHATQLAISEKIRKEYCDQLKFKLTDEQFAILNLIGNNVFVTSIKTLNEIEVFLLNLKEQNKKNKAFNENSFNLFLHKFWFDSCGYSNLGLAAYSLYSRSMLSKVTKVTLDKKSKLLTKCLIRKFRKA
ncbi:MAG: glycosyltransferase family 2 protein [Bacteroidia bacterium]|nr:glycosyltransferase family 2 protein [Bacteroidia bacterium]